MQRLPPLAVTALVVGGLTAGAGPAQAQVTNSASATMQVSVEVLPNCTVAAEPLTFGAVNAAEAPSHQATASIEVACGPHVAFTVALDDGQNPGVGTRRAIDPNTDELIAYDIYTDPARSHRWGSFGAQRVSATTSSTGTARLTAYGVIGEGTQVAAGRYGDVITVTAEF